MTNQYQRGQSPSRLTRALRLAGLGLGIVQLAAPRAVSRLTGARTVPLAGARELVHAAGLLAGRRPGRWAWSRVAGDAIDLAALATAIRRRPGPPSAGAVAVTAAVAGITALDVYTALRASRAERDTDTGSAGSPADHTMRLEASITVRSPRTEVFLFWTLFDNLPTFMSHLRSVRDTGNGRTHWTANSPIGRPVEWDAELVVEIPDELITWRSLDGADVPNSGSVRFTDAPAGQGTEVRVQIDFSLPAGRLGAAVARMFGEHPEQQVRDDLRRFKQVLETGEVVRSEGSPNGTNARRQLKQRPAQPVA